MSNLIGVSDSGNNPEKRAYRKTGVSISRLSDGRTRKLVGVNKKKKGGLAGG